MGAKLILIEASGHHHLHKSFLQVITEKAHKLYLIFVFMNTEQDIKSRSAIRKERLKDRYPIVSMALFGSYARNEQTAKSDLDVMVEFNGKMGSNFIDMALEMEQFLGIKVDLVSRKGIKEQYFKAIESDLIYAKKD